MSEKRKTTEVRQQEIIEAVRKLIVTSGMEHLTMQAIAKEVGLTEGAIYRHFTSKQEILFLLIEEIEETLLETLSKAQTEGAPALENLESILKAHFSYAERRRGVSFMVIAEIQALQDKALRKRVSQFLAKYRDVITDELNRGVESGEVPKDIDLDAAATIFFGLIQSNVTLWSLGDHPFPRQERQKHLWDLYIRGIAAREVPRPEP